MIRKTSFSEISTSLKISMSLPSSLLYTIFNFRTHYSLFLSKLIRVVDIKQLGPSTMYIYVICLLSCTNSCIRSDVILKVSYIKRYFEIEGT